MANTRRARGGRRTRRRTAARRGGFGGYDVSAPGVMAGGKTAARKASARKTATRKVATRKTATRKVAGGKRREMRRRSRARRGGKAKHAPLKPAMYAKAKHPIKLVGPGFMPASFYGPVKTQAPPPAQSEGSYCGKGQYCQIPGEPEGDFGNY